MPSPFAQLLVEALAQARVTQRELAKRLGVTQGFVGQVATSRSALPNGAERRWADALGLSGEERRAFEFFGVLTRCPQWVQDEAAVLWNGHAPARQKRSTLTKPKRRLPKNRS